MNVYNALGQLQVSQYSGVIQNAKRSIFLSLSGGLQSVTLPGVWGAQYETANKTNWKGTIFAAAAGGVNAYHEWGFVLPENFSSTEATITAKPVFYCAATDANAAHFVRLGLAATTFASGDAMSTAYANPQKTDFTDLSGAAYRVLIGTATPAITITGTPDGGKWCQVRCYRDGDDDFTGDVIMLGWMVTYTTNNYSDE